MNVGSQRFVALGPTDFKQVLVNRIRELEIGLLSIAVEQTELLAVRDTLHGREADYKDVLDGLVDRLDLLNKSESEIRARIDALIALSPEEFEEPKGE